MGKVVMTLKITPESPETDLEQLKGNLEKTASEFGEVNDMKEIPIGFGIKVLEFLLVFPERPGGTDDIENALSNVEGVKEVENTNIALM